MPRSEVRATVLFEDDAQGHLLRRLLPRLGLDGRATRFVRCGDSTRVLDNFRTEIAALRRKRHQKNLGLLVAIDGDAPGLSRRHAELDALVREQGEPRGESERIAYVVPCRAIETWYVHFCDPTARPVDPELDYKPTSSFRALDLDLGAAAREVALHWPPEAERLDPESVVLARKELDRLS